MHPTKPEQTPVNDSGTKVSSDTDLTQARSGPVLRYELLDAAGNSWGFFDTRARAARFAEKIWPNQQHDDETWDVRAHR